MATNLMGNFRKTNESDLVADLVEEAIEQRGFEVHYIKRNMINPDQLLGESTISEFKDFYLMPMFLESMEHFNGSGDLYDQFGMSFTDAAIYQVGARRFRSTLNDPEVPRPREGDLIYVPFSDSLWEVHKVKMDLMYYQMGKNNSYRLICKLFEYSHEEIEGATETDFNAIGTEIQVDDEGLQKLFGLNPTNKADETAVIQAEAKKSETFDPNDPFAF